MKQGIFDNWKCRCSSLGYIMTNRETITESQLAELKKLQDRKNDPKQKDLTQNMEDKLSYLISLRDKPDELSSGIITHLDNVFRAKYWGRSRLLYNKYLDKGNLCEEDSLDLISKLDGKFYRKNDEHFENDFICGTPDNVQDYIKDIKSNYDMESFDNAELTNLYTWQVKGYIWLLLSRLKNWNGELAYCLVNSPWHQLQSDKTSLYYKMGMPDDDDPLYVEARQQLERNHIYDIERWRENYPNHDFENDILDFSVPAKLRVKRFDITLNTRDIAFMKRRVKMCREYLINKEKELVSQIQD